jgi:Protein of unknown function (DUF3102)
MSTDDRKLVSNSLIDMAARIRAEHEASDAALKCGLEHAVNAGKMLIEAKALLKHGEWLPWLRDHCAMSERKAQRYMEIAPHVCKSDTLSDLAPPDPVTAEWADQALNQPFIERDFANGNSDCLRWRQLKLMRHVGVPSVPGLLLTEDEIEGHPLLRLCTFDDLEAAAKALAPVASGKAPFKIDRDSMADVLESVGLLRIIAMWLLGKLLTEIKYRFDLPDDDDERYRKEWHETHSAWMERLDTDLASVTAQNKKPVPENATFR